jgi:ABC transporter with metal-binding/Fe-S-binding domain ATP-binding protein
MHLASLFSGGKDSTYATYLMKKEGYEIDVLVTMKPEKEDSYMFHHPNIDLTKVQAHRMQIPHMLVHTAAKKEEEVQDLKKVLAGLDVDGVVTGALASQYQKSRIEKICNEIGIFVFSPLWHRNPLVYMSEELDAGFKIIITAVAAEGFDESWLGREINQEMLQELEKLNEKYGIHIGFEGGEAETFVYDCPMFSKPIKITNVKKHWDGSRGWLEILEIE